MLLSVHLSVSLSILIREKLHQLELILILSLFTCECLEEPVADIHPLVAAESELGANQ